MYILVSERFIELYYFNTVYWHATFNLSICLMSGNSWSMLKVYWRYFQIIRFTICSVIKLWHLCFSELVVSEPIELSYQNHARCFLSTCQSVTLVILSANCSKPIKEKNRPTGITYRVIPLRKENISSSIWNKNILNDLIIY